MHQKLIDTSVGKIHVAERLGTGIPIVMWPSIFYDGSLYSGLSERLDGHLVLVDGPGHGKSSLNLARLTMAECASALNEVLDQLKIQEAIVLGTSWGGIVAVEYALHHPERVRGIVLLNTPFDMPDHPSLMTRLTVSMTRLIPNLDFFKRNVARSFFAPSTWRSQPEVIESFLQQKATFKNPRLHSAVKAVLLDRSSIVPRLASLTKPALVIAGAEDSLYSVFDLEHAAALIPNHEFHVVANSAHISAAEQPNSVTELVKGFIAKVE